MTAEEKDLIDQIRSKDADLKTREKAMKRIGEILEETFILDLLPSKKLMNELNDISTATGMAPTLKKKAKALFKKYRL